MKVIFESRELVQLTVKNRCKLTIIRDKSLHLSKNPTHALCRTYQGCGRRSGLRPMRHSSCPTSRRARADVPPLAGGGTALDAVVHGAQCRKALRRIASGRGGAHGHSLRRELQIRSVRGISGRVQNEDRIVCRLRRLSCRYQGYVARSVRAAEAALSRSVGQSLRRYGAAEREVLRCRGRSGLGGAAVAARDAWIRLVRSAGRACGHGRGGQL